MDRRKQQLMVRGNYVFKVNEGINDTILATLVETPEKEKDDIGALTYVVVVIMLYATSILLMMASYIKKNKVDSKVNRYLKEMARVRKRERHAQVFATARAFAASTLEAKNPAGFHKKARRYEETSFALSKTSDHGQRRGSRLAERRGGIFEHGQPTQLLLPPSPRRMRGHRQHQLQPPPRKHTITEATSLTFTAPWESDNNSGDDRDSAGVPLIGGRWRSVGLLPECPSARAGRDSRRLSLSSDLLHTQHARIISSEEESALESDAPSEDYCHDSQGSPTGAAETSDQDETSHEPLTLVTAL